MPLYLHTLILQASICVTQRLFRHPRIRAATSQCPRCGLRFAMVYAGRWGDAAIAGAG
jgi:hypothetical protein